MPPKGWTFRLNDILKAAKAISQYTSGMNYAAFIKDRRTVDAVVRNFIVIGEAAARVPDEFCQSHPDIPWSEMRAMRNFVVHEYFNVSDRLLWNSVEIDIPQLISDVEKLLQQ